MPDATPLPHSSHAGAPAPYPLLFEPVVMEKVWGGRRLAALGKRLAKPDAKYGESWELADMGATSASGAGGGAVRSVIANGALKGKTIRDAMELWGDLLISRAALGIGYPPVEIQGTPFPLLIKFLDASENLSVQVHPSPEYARSHADAHLKTECWYVMDAAPGAVIYKGIKRGVTREEFARLARAGDARIVDAMIAEPAVVGECHNLPSGTVHALGAGVLVAEVQTPSDTTFRLYDWGRKGREMHVEQALECALFEPPPPPTAFAGGPAWASLDTDYFMLTQVGVGEAGMPLAVKRGQSFTVLQGRGRIDGPGCGAFGGPIEVDTGRTGWIPAGIGGEVEIAGAPGTTLTLLCAQPSMLAGKVRSLSH